jgi:very-short-patch-repair endonuclease
MTHVRLHEAAARQHRCLSLDELREHGLSDEAIALRVERGWLTAMHDAVYAVGPVGDDEDRVRWMAATLTAPRSFLSHAAAGNALGFWPRRPAVPIITRPGNAGPRLHDGVMIFRSRHLAGETTTLDGIPILIPERVAVDLAAKSGPDRNARMVREAIRLKVTTAADLLDYVRRHPGRRGTRRIYIAASRYAGLPLNRSRSDAEARALELLRDWGVEGFDHNEDVAGEEADFSWPEHRVIVEIDGPQFHLDKAEDARKRAIWEAAGWEVRRLPSDDVYLRPERLRVLIPAPNVRLIRL